MVRMRIRRVFVRAIRNSLLLSILIFVGAWIVIAIIADLQEDTSSVAKRAMSSAAVATGPNDLRVDSWLDDSRVDPGNRINYSFSVTNASNHPVTDVGIVANTFKHPSLTETRGMTNERFNLRPGEVATFAGQLVASDTPGKYGIGAIVAWRDGRIERTKPFGIGPVTIENPSARRRTRALRTFQSIFKDIALPLALAFIAYRFTNAQNEQEAARRRREAAQQRHEKDIEAQRQHQQTADNERSARLYQTWTFRLPKLSDNAEKYYLPLMATAWNVVKYYDGSDADRDICFFFYLRFLAIGRRMVDAINGFNLRHREGEEIAARLWSLLLDLIDERAGRRARERAQMAVMQRRMTYDEFETGAATTQLMKTMRANFCSEAGFAAFQIDVCLLDLFATILMYEVNCGYEYWYDTPEEFPESEWSRLVARFNELGALGFLTPEKFGSLSTALADYKRLVDKPAPAP